MVNTASFRALLSPAGQQLLQAAVALSPKESDFLIHFQSLSRHYPPDLARTALEIAILRQEATVKFPFADRLYFTRQALEQASSYEVSSYRSERYRSFQSLVDLGCSIGADTYCLARIAPTVGIDIDPLRLMMASANLDVLGLSAQVCLIQANLADPLPVAPDNAALFFDPARRTGHQRMFSVEQYQPPLSIINHWLPTFPALGVKISPGVDLMELPNYQAEIEFISLRGELKETLLWFGPLKSGFRRATILPGPHQLAIDAPLPSDSGSTTTSKPKEFLYEPDPAVLRAGLVTILAEMLNASQLDPDIAYLTSERLSPTFFARVLRIEDWFPFQLKMLRNYLRQRNIGQVTVKKRGSPLEPDRLIHQLRLKGDLERILVLTHLRGEPIVMICNRL